MVNNNGDSLKTIDSLTVEDKKIAENTVFNYQPTLTEKLDGLTEEFTQNTIDEIVLWKVNRYASIDEATLIALNQISKQDKEIDTALKNKVLLGLLKCKGISLPMASTILRFKNPHVFQILDQRVYRYIYGKNAKYSTKADALVDMYFAYLDKLREKCEASNIAFEDADRILYLLDKNLNGQHRLKGY